MLAFQSKAQNEQHALFGSQILPNDRFLQTTPIAALI